jgi:hypothetical protein
MSLDSAEQSLKVATHGGNGPAANPRLRRRSQSNDGQLRHPRLQCDMCTGTLDAKIVLTSKREKSMLRSSQQDSAGTMPSHEGQSWKRMKQLPCHSLKMACQMSWQLADGAEEQTPWDFRKKCRLTSCHMKEMKTCSPWMNMAENGVPELKKALGREMQKKHSPKRLWDKCLELKGLIRSHAACT